MTDGVALTIETCFYMVLEAGFQSYHCLGGLDVGKPGVFCNLSPWLALTIFLLYPHGHLYNGTGVCTEEHIFDFELHYAFKDSDSKYTHILKFWVSKFWQWMCKRNKTHSFHFLRSKCKRTPGTAWSRSSMQSSGVWSFCSPSLSAKSSALCKVHLSS